MACEQARGGPVLCAHSKGKSPPWLHPGFGGSPVGVAYVVVVLIMFLHQHQQWHGEKGCQVHLMGDIKSGGTSTTAC